MATSVVQGTETTAEAAITAMNTATNALKPAKTETQADIQVPLFINEGDKIKIDTEKGAYIERVK